MNGRRVALVTADAARPLDEDLPPLVAALTAAGATADTPSWHDDTVDWARYDVAVLRSTWDYPEQIDRFLAWIDRVDAATRLLNPAAVVRWNTDKRYLDDLAAADVPTVPTAFVPPGAPFAPVTGGDFVVKPAVGAGSRGARRFRADTADDAAAHVALLHGEGRVAMVQPYLQRIDTHGETALVFLDGVFSHAIRKGPLLAREGGPVGGLFAPERIGARRPDPDELAVALLAVSALDAVPLYARVDLVRDDAGDPVVLELELTEPSLFFAHGPGGVDRFVAALGRRLSG